MEIVRAAYLNNEDELLSVASGGAATAFSREMLNRGGCVVGVRYSEDFRTNRYCVIYDENKLGLLKGSKYSEVSQWCTHEDGRPLTEGGKVFEVVKTLLKDKDVLFFGLPCIVSGLKNYLKNDKYNKQLITVGLICHGPVPQIAQEQYVNYLEKKYRSKILNFSVRRKIESWLPVYLYAEFENGKKYCKELYNTEFGFAFSIWGKESCYHCIFKNDKCKEDITIGDFWGVEKTNIPYSNLGTSVIISRTNKGESFVKENKELILYDSSMDEAVKYNPMLVTSRAKNEEFDKFDSLMKSHDIIYTARHCSFTWKMIKKLIPEDLRKLIIKILAQCTHPRV